MNRLIVGIIALVPALLGGCTTAQTKITEPVFHESTNGTAIVANRTIEQSVTTAIQGTTALEKMTASSGTWNGNRSSTGIAGLTQKSDAAELVAAGAAAFAQGAAAVGSGGATTIIPRPIVVVTNPPAK